MDVANLAIGPDDPVFDIERRRIVLRLAQNLPEHLAVVGMGPLDILVGARQRGHVLLDRDAVHSGDFLRHVNDLVRDLVV